MNDYVTHLFPYLPKEKIRTLSCGHVIPKENLVALPVSRGPSGGEFEFNFEKRMLPAMVGIHQLDTALMIASAHTTLADRGLG